MYNNNKSNQNSPRMSSMVCLLAAGSIFTSCGRALSRVGMDHALPLQQEHATPSVVENISPQIEQKNSVLHADPRLPASWLERRALKTARKWKNPAKTWKTKLRRRLHYGEILALYSAVDGIQGATIGAVIGIPVGIFSPVMGTMAPIIGTLCGIQHGLGYGLGFMKRLIDLAQNNLDLLDVDQVLKQARQAGAEDAEEAVREPGQLTRAELRAICNPKTPE